MDDIRTLSVDDRLRIGELTYLYAYHLDHGEVDALMTLWTEDAVLDERPLGRACAVGAAEIRASIAAAVGSRNASIHTVVNHVFTLDASKGVRSVSCGIQELDLPTGAVVRRTVDYIDGCIRQNGVWLLAHRTVRPLTATHSTAPRRSHRGEP